MSGDVGFFPHTWRQSFWHKVFDVWGLCLLTWALVILGSLLTYDPMDPSWNTYITNAVYTNFFGETGAYIADFLKQTLGVWAIMIPMCLLVWSFRAFMHKTLPSFFKRILTLVTTAILMDVTTSLMVWRFSLRFFTPGLLGKSFYTYIANHPNLPISLHIGFWLFLSIGLVFSITGFIYACGLSLGEWRHVFHKSLTITSAFYNVCIRYPAAFLEKLLTFYKRPTIHEVDDEYTVSLNGPKEPTFGGAPIHHETDTYHANDHIVDFPQDEVVKPKKRLGSMDTSGVVISMPDNKTTPKTTATSQPANAAFQLSNSYILPSLDLLYEPNASEEEITVNKRELEESIERLARVLEDFGIKGKIVRARPGPVVTLYEFEPAPGIKSSRIIGLADDIARSMSALSARISLIPGKTEMGIELPNRKRQTVHLYPLLAHGDFENPNSKLTLALGKNISGDPVLTDLARMPHMIVAGTTGSGKSVGVNAMILSLLYRHSPETCRFIMIDPKMLELSVYNGIPHLLTPVVTDPQKAIFALKWTVKEMENRYRAMSQAGVRNIEGYNQFLLKAISEGRTLSREVHTGFDPSTGRPVMETQEINMTPLPYIVVVVDEMADLMMVAGKEIEAAVQRLAQMARAAGIHVIMATQRPSVDVITGTIKANFPTRISFQVTSKFDSKTILGEQGAEQLLGRGDMLFMEAGGKIQRVHGPFVSDNEVESVVTYLKSQGEPDYIDTVTEEGDDFGLGALGGDDEGDDLYRQAVDIVRTDQKASTSYIQRKLQIGYNRAARIMEQMETNGVVSSANHVGKREVLM